MFRDGKLFQQLKLYHNLHKSALFGKQFKAFVAQKSCL